MEHEPIWAYDEEDDDEDEGWWNGLDDDDEEDEEDNWETDLFKNNELYWAWDEDMEDWVFDEEQ